MPVSEFLKKGAGAGGFGGAAGAKARGDLNEKELAKLPPALPTDKDGKADGTVVALQRTKEALDNIKQFQFELRQGNLGNLQAGRYGVEWSQNSANLRNQSCLTQNAQRRAGDRNCLEIGGVWIDEAYKSSLPTVTVKAMSEAYFRIVERHPSMLNVFRIGNHLVWVTPSGTALVLDTTAGQETMSDADIDKLFVAKAK